MEGGEKGNQWDEGETGGGPERNQKGRESTGRGASEAEAWESEPEGT